MSTSRTRPGWRALESLFDAGALGGLTDGELLECFQTSRDTVGHDAFRILVERHGPMVLGMCRSLVRDPHEADDAFQATFLVLVRKAGSIERRDTIGPWLHGVAGRVARRAVRSPNPRPWKQSSRTRSPDCRSDSALRWSFAVLRD
jgi:DNA-directed RNA polymerase specialized sigma24 family protein